MRRRSRSGSASPSTPTTPVSPTAPGPVLPWLLRTGLSPAEAETRVENWVGVLQEVALPGCGGDAAAFLAAAVEYANSACAGSLSVMLIAPPDAPEDAVEAAIAGERGSGGTGGRGPGRAGPARRARGRGRARA